MDEMTNASPEQILVTKKNPLPKIIIAVVLLIILYFGLVFYSSSKTEELVREHYQKVTKDGFGGFIVQKDYQKGFFSSTDTGVLTLPPSLFENTIDSDIVVTVVSEIKHGPLPGFTGFGLAKSTSKLIFGEQGSAIVKKIFAGKEPIINVTYAFNGDSSGEVIIPNIDYVDQHASFLMKQAVMEFFVSRDQTKITVNLQPLDISFSEKDNDVTFEFKALRILTDQYSPDPTWVNFRLGSQKLLIEKVTVKGADKNIEINNIDFNANAKQNGDFLEVFSKISSPKALIDDVDYAPFNFDMSIKKVHLKSAIAAHKEYIGFSLGLLNTKDGETVNTEEMMFKMFEKITPFVEEMLKHNPEFAIDKFNFKIPEGAVDFTAKVAGNGITIKDIAESNPEIMTKVNAQAKLTIPESTASTLILMTGEDVSPEVLIEQGFVTKEGKNLLSTVTLEGGKLTLNGKEVPLD